MLKTNMEGADIPESIFEKDGEVYLIVEAKPNSKNDSVLDVTEEAVSVSITAPPKDGQANLHLKVFFAEVLGLKKRDIDVDKGSRS